MTDRLKLKMKIKNQKQVAKPDHFFKEVNIFKEVNNAGLAVVSPCREEWWSEGDRIYHILMMAYNKEIEYKRKDRKRFGT